MLVPGCAGVATLECARRSPVCVFVSGCGSGTSHFPCVGHRGHSRLSPSASSPSGSGPLISGWVRGTRRGAGPLLPQAAGGPLSALPAGSASRPARCAAPGGGLCPGGLGLGPHGVAGSARRGPRSSGCGAAGPSRIAGMGWDGASAVSRPLPRGLSSSGAGTGPRWPPPSCLLEGGAGRNGQAWARARVRARAHGYTHGHTRGHMGTHTTAHQATYVRTVHLHGYTHTRAHTQSCTHHSVDPPLLPPARHRPWNALTSPAPASFSPPDPLTCS